MKGTGPAPGAKRGGYAQYPCAVLVNTGLTLPRGFSPRLQDTSRKLRRLRAPTGQSDRLFQLMLVLKGVVAIVQRHRRPTRS